jgi:phosphonate transport system substrate-binding protein
LRLVLASYLSTTLEPLYRGTAKYLARMLGCDVEFVIGSSFDQFGRDVDLGFICGLPYVRLADRVHPIVAPVPRAERYRGGPIYFSDVIVNADSDVISFAGLGGARWCFNDVDSHSGYGVVLYHLAQMGATPNYFSRFEPSGSHLESVRRVAAGEADASAIDSHLLDVLRRDEPELVGELRVITSIGPSTIQPLVAADRIPAELRERIWAALTDMHNDTDGVNVLSYGLVSRFETVADSSYDDIRSMLETAGIAV